MVLMNLVSVRLTLAWQDINIHTNHLGDRISKAIPKIYCCVKVFSSLIPTMVDKTVYVARLLPIDTTFDVCSICGCSGLGKIIEPTPVFIEILC
jgi:hypothetical protein